MERKRMVWGRRGTSLGLLLSGFLVNVALLLLSGCGQQDLYKPPEESGFHVVGQLALSNACEDVFLLDGTAYVAGGQAGLFIVDVTNPAAPVLVGKANTAKGTVAVAAVSTTSESGTSRYAFLADGTEGVAVFDVTRPDSAVTFTPLDTFDARGVSVAQTDDPSAPYSVFVADSWRGLWQLDSVVGFPGSLFMSGRSFTTGAAQDVVVRDGFAYVADDETGVTVVDARVPVGMTTASSCETDGNAQGIALEGEHIFVADGKDGLVVMSIHQGDAPMPVSHLQLPGDCRSIAVRDGRAFVAAYDGGVHVVDVSDPIHPRLLSTTLTGKATGVSVSTDGLVAVSDEIGGLFLLSGGGGFSDLTAPGAVGSLSASPRDSSSVVVRWNAPGDDLYDGRAASYDLHYALTPITDASWDQATPASGLPAPAKSGTREQYVLTGLQPATTYSIALKTLDRAGNRSRLSNVVSVVTYAGNVPPTLSNPVMTPAGGAPQAPITFEVTYADPEGDQPSRFDVVISGSPYPMEPQGSDYVNGVVFRLVKTLDAGTYDHSFQFDDGHEHPVSTPLEAGPWIGNVATLGSPADEPGRDSDEDQHLVLLAGDYWIADHEVTQAEWDSIAPSDPQLPANPSHFRGPDRPVESVTWFDAIRYCNARSEAKGLTKVYEINGSTVTFNQQANGYRLPTEAEWETACRGGTNTAFFNGALTVQGCLDSGQPDPNLALMGWYCGNSGNTTHDVKQLAPNTFGSLHLYDMHGNVWEWCWDWYSEHGVVGVPTGPERGTQRVIRGGSWYYYARECRSASRAPYWPYSKDDVVGFRVARNLP